jgi:hypothetical protein
MLHGMAREMRKIRGGREEEVQVCSPDWNERWKAPPATAEAGGGGLERRTRHSKTRRGRDRLSAELDITLGAAASPDTVGQAGD